MHSFYLVPLAFAIAASAQDPRPIAPSTFPARVPIHSGTDDPVAGRYGLWTAGPGYKASFHDGFAFYPYIPGQATPRALHWRTEAIELGGRWHDAGVPVTKHTELRCTLQHPEFTEIYDVRDDGVEQSFVIDQRPDAGDIVVVGRVATPFVAAPVLDSAGAIEFHDEHGRAVVTYGAAVAIDARGERLDLATAFDGERIRLRVPAQFVARAQFPLTIDPLSAVTIVSLASGQPVRGTSIVASSAAGDHECFVAVVREFAATDYDVVAYRMTDTGSVVSTLFSDITTNWSSGDVDVAQLASGPDWFLAMERTAQGVVSARGYWHPQRVVAMNGGVSFVVGANLGQGCRHPRVGGRLGNGIGSTNSVLFVYNDESSAAPNPYAMRFTTTSRQGVPFPLRGTAARIGDSHEPCINEAAGGSDAWRVAWVEDGATASTLRVALVTDQTAITAVRPLATAANLRAPRLAGTGNRYLATYLATDPTSGNTQLAARRFDMATTGTMTLIGDHEITSIVSGFGLLLFNGDLSYDVMTQSHWALTYHRRTVLTPGSTSAFAVRVGSSGGVVEAASIHPSTSEGVGNTSVAWNGYPLSGEPTKFLLTFSTTTPSQPAYFRTFEYAVGTGAFYGNSCANNTYADGHPPYAGSQYYYTGVLGLAVGTSAVAFVGFSPANVPLDPIGMTGCRLLVNSALSLPATAELTGFARIYLPLADDPLFLGTLYLQWAWLAPGANALGLVSGVGARIEVR